MRLRMKGFGKEFVVPKRSIRFSQVDLFAPMSIVARISLKAMMAASQCLRLRTGRMRHPFRGLRGPTGATVPSICSKPKSSTRSAPPINAWKSMRKVEWETFKGVGWYNNPSQVHSNLWRSPARPSRHHRTHRARRSRGGVSHANLNTLDMVA